MFLLTSHNLKAQDTLQCGFKRDFFSPDYINWYQKAVFESREQKQDKRGKIFKDTEYIIPVVFHLIYPSMLR